MNPEAVQWLRAQVETRLTRAKAAGPGTGQWEAEGDDPTDDEVYSASEAPDFFGDRVAILRGRNSHENMVHIAANDPQQIIADCEADLAILDAWQAAVAMAARFSDDTRWRAGQIEALEWAAGAVASRFKHQPGYAAHWGETATRP